MTGNAATYNAVVWGNATPPSDHEDEKRNDKEITAELGNVTPYIVVPGKWSEADLKYQAENIISGTYNGPTVICTNYMHLSRVSE